MFDIEKMRQRVMEMADPKNPYSQEDFNAEFNQTTMTAFDFRIPLKFTNKSTNEDPQYATDGSSGFDLRANLEESLIVKAGKRNIVPTGLYFETP